MDSPNFNGHLLAQITREHGFECEVERLKCSDEYFWFWCLVCNRGNTTVVIALPWAQDWDATDGTRSDRHSAVYTYGSVSDEKLEEIVGEFAESMKAHSTKNNQAA